MDNLWKTIGFIGLEILDICSCHPISYPKDAAVAEVPAALLAVALLLVSIVCLVACVCCRENQRKGFKADSEEKEKEKEFRDSTHSVHHVGLSFTNPGLSPGSELAIFPPPGATPASTPIVTFEPLPFPANLSPVTVHTAKKPAYRNLSVNSLSDADWFANGNSDFPRDQLQYLQEYGRGWFGRVVEGEARGTSDVRHKVMVRMLREDATPAEQRCFLNEAKPYRDLKHPNVLKLVGRCLETNPYLILLEACSGGDLKSFLCGNLASSNVLCEQGVCLRIMCQVTSGLQHMISNGFVHTDLAARNCLVTSDLTVKVGDYGTSIETYKDDYYIAGDVAVPIRWCAPETLHCTDTTIETKQVTAEANVWSLGVLLWEVCQFGQIPYSNLTDDQVIVRVLGGEGLRLPCPTLHNLHTNALHQVMGQCWQPVERRASLDHVLSMLNHLHSSHSEEDFQRRWDALRPSANPEITLETLTTKSDFDSGVDLEIKSSDREMLDLVKKSSSDVNMSPSTASPQLSVASSSGGEFFSQSSLSALNKQQSPSLTNLRGSVEDVSKLTEKVKSVNLTNDTEEFDSWLKGVETKNEEDVKFVKKISEAIKDLDDALALEKTSSSSDDSSRHESPLKDTNIKDENPVLDFRLGPQNQVRKQISLQPDSLQDDSLVRRDSSGTDTEEETWRGRIERGEFSEKVKEKSKSVTDLMILTHIESEGSESDSLPSLTRQYSIDKNKRKPSGAIMSTIGFGSEGNIRGAVLGEEFQDALKQLQAEWKIRDSESRENSLHFIKNEAQSSQHQDKLDFLSNDASEKNKPQVTRIPENDEQAIVAILPAVMSKPACENNVLQGKAAPSLSTPDNLSEKPDNCSTHIDSESELTDNYKKSEKSIKVSPETTDISDNSQITESSSEISTPTQYEVLTVQSFLESEKQHSSLNKTSSGSKMNPSNLNNFSEVLNFSISASEKSSLAKEIDEVPSESVDTEVESVKIVPKYKDEENHESGEIYQTKIDCDKISNSLSSSLILNTDTVFTNTDEVCANDNAIENAIDFTETFTQYNSNDLLNNSATQKEYNAPSDDLVVTPLERLSSANELKKHFFCKSNSTEIKASLKTPNFLLSKDESKTFVPEIVVTEASILDIESDSEPEIVLPNSTRSKRSIRIIMSDSDDSEDSDRFIGDVIVSNDPVSTSNEIFTITPYPKVGSTLPTDDTVSDIDLTFPELEKSEPFVVPLSKDNILEPTEETSVILGSCEDYTLDYFKGLKTTFGKQTSDESTDEFSKSEGEEDEKKQVSINNWDDFLTSSLHQRYHENMANSDVEFETSDTDFELNDKNRDNIERTDEFSEKLDILEPKINLNEHFNKEMRKDIVICDRMNMYDKFSGKNYEDHDQQLQEVKSRLEDVAMLSQSFCLKNQSISMDDDEDGKLLTPDDERSSDSGFRDKGSLSESVEDACDEKYNLEDIDAELEEQYGKHQDSRCGDDSQDSKTEIKDDSVLSTDIDGMTNCDTTFVVNEGNESVSNSTVSTVKASESSSEVGEVACLPTEPLNKQERLNKLDSALDSNIDLYFDAQPKTGWYLHPPPGTSSLDSQPVNSGWLPTAPEEGKDSSYVSFDIDEEFVTAIRNELREKLPCAQNAERTDNEEDISPEEERTDMVIQYNTFPAPLSPIIEERESISSTQSSLLLDDAGKSIESSGKLSPILFIDNTSEKGVLCKFEDDIMNALDVCNSESTDSDNILVTVEDLEISKAGEAHKQKIVETAKEEMDDLLIVDTETNKVTLYESPKPQSQLAFVRQLIESTDDTSSANSESCTFYHSADDNLLSVDRNNLTYTPDSVSPLSTGSSRTGVAVSFSSSETGGNLSGFYLSPSSVRSDLFDNGPPSLPFDLGQTYDMVEEIRPNNEAEEIIQELVEAGIMKEIELGKATDFTVEGLNCGLVNSKDSEETSKTTESQTTEDKNEESGSSLESSVVKSENCDTLDSKELPIVMKDNSIQISSISPKNNSIKSCDKIDELIVSKNKQSQPFEESHSKSKICDENDWLKSVLLPSSNIKSDPCGSSKNEVASVCLNNSEWPSAEELIAETKCEAQVVVATPESPSMDLLEVAAKFNDVNSTLAISTPNNMSFDESKDNSQVSSFTSTPTLETVKCITGSMKCPEKLVSEEHNNQTEVGSRMKSIPTLSNLASEIVLQLPVSEERREALSQDSSPDDSERARRLQGMTLALEPSVVSKAPMPSPEDADKGTWRPTMGQLMELTSQPEQDDMMTTSFIDADNNDYTPDWESDTSDDSEEHSSSSGEFIWREGDREAAVRVVIACDDLEPQDGVSETSMARISEEDEEGDDNSSCGSTTTEFIPSVWDSSATPTKSALRSTEKEKREKRNVFFKRQKYHCVYEYPREPSDSEDDEDTKILQRRSWQSPSTFDYSTYADWEYGEGEVEEVESDSDDNTGPRQLPESEYDFYRLSNLDFDMMTQMNLDDGEFFISSSARPFHMGDSSQFFPGSLSEDDDFLVEFKPSASDIDKLVIPSPDHLQQDDTVSVVLREVVKPEDHFTEVKEKQKPSDLYIVAEPSSGNTSSAEVSPTLGELRHTRQRLKLDLGRGGVRGEASLLDSGGEDSGVESTATGSSDRLDQVQSSEA